MEGVPFYSKQNPQIDPARMSAELLATVITFPLEVLKTRYQALNNKEMFVTKSTVRNLGVIFKIDGLRGLFSGFTPNLVGVILTKPLFLGFFALSKSSINWIGIQDSSTVRLTSTFFAGIVTTTILSPIWLVKTRMQLQTNVPGTPRYANSLDCIQKTIKGEGYAGIFKGLGTSYFALSETYIQFFLYSKLKEVTFGTKVLTKSELTISQERLSFYAFISKATAMLITYPLEVAKTRLREQNWVRTYHRPYKYQDTFDAMWIIFKEEKFRGLYSGMGISLLKSIPSTLFVFYTYEVIAKLLSVENKQEKKQ